MATEHSQQQEDAVKHAVDEGIARYIESRRAKVPEFVDRRFSFKGALRLHRKAVGKDLYRGPLNLLWAVPSVIFRASAALLGRVGAKKLARRLEKIPLGLETEVQKEVNWLIYTELLEIPYAPGGRSSEKDALLTEILADPAVASQLAEYFCRINERSNDPAFRSALEKNLREYATSRTAASDLAGNVITLSAGFVAFHKAVPGALAAGSATASAIAQQIAISNFWLGTTVGTWYYGLFSASASAGLLVATTGSLLAALAVITTFAGVITDPLQAKLGIHSKRLLKFIDAFARELQGKGKSEYRIKDQYFARVFDILDLLKTAAQAL